MPQGVLSPSQTDKFSSRNQSSCLVEAAKQIASAINLADWLVARKTVKLRRPQELGETF